jgi:hypothetical protein
MCVGLGTRFYIILPHLGLADCLAVTWRPQILVIVALRTWNLNKYRNYEKWLPQHVNTLTPTLKHGRWNKPKHIRNTAAVRTQGPWISGRFYHNRWLVRIPASYFVNRGFSYAQRLSMVPGVSRFFQSLKSHAGLAHPKTAQERFFLHDQSSTFPFDPYKLCTRTCRFLRNSGNYTYQLI